MLVPLWTEVIFCANKTWLVSVYRRRGVDFQSVPNTDRLCGIPPAPPPATPIPPEQWGEGGMGRGGTTFRISRVTKTRASFEKDR